MNSLLQLLFPISCLICGQSGCDLCSSCGLKITRNDRGLVLDGLRVQAAALYGDELARISLLAKEKNNLLARIILVELLLESFGELTRPLRGSLSFTLIPIPSRPAANRKRGYQHSLLLARALASTIAKEDAHRIVVKEALRVNRKTADQTTLNQIEREKNLAGAFSLMASPGRALIASPIDLVILIDDLVTSGSSIREGQRALKEAGITPFGALCAGVSPRLFS